MKKYIPILALFFSCTANAQTKADSTFFYPSTSKAFLVFYDTVVYKEFARFDITDSTWIIKDTMGLIKDLYNSLQKYQRDLDNHKDKYLALVAWTKYWTLHWGTTDEGEQKKEKQLKNKFLKLQKLYP